MNSQRRKSIREALNLIDKARSILEDAANDESESVSNLPENLQDSEKAEQMETNVYIIEEYASSLECTEEIEEMLETA
jgi:hypothetical protein